MDENKNNGNFEEESFARSEMRNEAPQQPAPPDNGNPPPAVPNAPAGLPAPAAP